MKRADYLYHRNEINGLAEKPFHASAVADLTGEVGGTDQSHMELGGYVPHSVSPSASHLSPTSWGRGKAPSFAAFLSPSIGGEGGLRSKPEWASKGRSAGRNS